jgi:hypothetical protein
VSRFSYSRRPNLWVSPSVPTARDMGLWDKHQYKGVNGDAGGTWSPTSPIIIGGSGIQLSGAGNVIAGGVTTQAGGRLSLGSSDFVQLNTRTRTEVMGLFGALPDLFQNGLGGTPASVCVISPPFPLGISPISPTSVGDFVVPIPSRYLHQGATLTGATLSLRALVRQPTIGISQPAYANIIAMNAANTVTQSLVPAFAVWQASHAYALHSVVIPNNASTSQTGYYYVATSVFGTGTSGSTPPSWPATIGSTVIDNAGGNEIVWTCEGFAGTLTYSQSFAGETYGGGAVQLPQMTPGSTFSPMVIDCTQFDYYLQYEYDNLGSGPASGPYWLFHALALSYGNITSTQFE